MIGMKIIMIFFEKYCSLSSDVFEGWSTEGWKADTITQWNIGCNYRFTWSHIALGHSGAGGSAAMEGLIFLKQICSCFLLS